MHNLSEDMHNNNFKFEEEHTDASLLPKSMNSPLTKILEKASKIKEGSSSDPKYVLKKLLQDFETLEKFYTDKEYRNKLESEARYPSLEYVQLENIYDQDIRLKHRLNLPENSTIKLEKVKGSNQRYWYAYSWNPGLKKLKKRYIGKALPLPYY